MTIDLSGPRTKLKRAREHSDTLKSEVGPIFDVKRDPIELSAKLDPDSGEHIFRVSKIPSERLARIATILGDIAHNLRSALDHIAWQLVIHHSGWPRKPKEKTDIEFPIKFSHKALASTYTYSKVSDADRTCLDLAQPYNGPGDPRLQAVAVIRQLSNRDKHRVFNPILVGTNYITVEGTALEGKGVFAVDWGVTGEGKNLKIGTELMRAVLPSGVDDEMEVAGYAAPDVKLPQGNHRVPSVADVLIAQVEEIIRLFADEHGV